MTEPGHIPNPLVLSSVFQMSSLARRRKERNLTQKELGLRLAQHLKRDISPIYAQRKIARYESGDAAPTPEELDVLAVILGMPPEKKSSLVTPRAPQEIVSVIQELGSLSERSLVAVCCLSPARPRSLTESFESVRNAVEGQLSMALFLPFPREFSFHRVSDNLAGLAGEYARIRETVLQWTYRFKKSLAARHDAVAVYAPSYEELSPSDEPARLNIPFLIPPFARNIALILRPTEESYFRKEIYVWSPGLETDISRPIRATGVATVEQQANSWMRFFGNITQYWITTGVLRDRDEYWQKIPDDSYLGC